MGDRGTVQVLACSPLCARAFYFMNIQITVRKEIVAGPSAKVVKTFVLIQMFV